MSTVSEAFRTIYQSHSWGGKSKSGPGSDPNSTRRYRRALARFMRKNRVRSVVDLGCGDWASSRLIDWSGIDYLGLDAVPEVVERNQRAFGRTGIRFEVAECRRPTHCQRPIWRSARKFFSTCQARRRTILKKLTSFRVGDSGER